MKKNILKLLSLAVIGTMFVGCQKEKEGRLTITFENADNPKSYISTNLFNCWEKENEKLYINGTPLNVIVPVNTGDVAYVDGVTEEVYGTDLYGFYDGTANGAQFNTSNHTYSFEVSETMRYNTLSVDYNFKQKTDAPVVGKTRFNNGRLDRLVLKNVGSMLKFAFKEGQGTNTIYLQDIQIYSNKYLAGPATVVASDNPSAYTILNNASQSDKSKRMLFYEGNNPETSNGLLLSSDSTDIYFPIVSLSGATIRIMFTVRFASKGLFYILSPEITNASIARNQLMNFGTFTIEGANGGGNSANAPTILINGTQPTFANNQNDNTKWYISKNLPQNIHY